MKILRKKDDFKKMPDKTIDDVLKINSLINSGWQYCPRKVYKEFFKAEEKKETEKLEKKSSEKLERKPRKEKKTV